MVSCTGVKIQLVTECMHHILSAFCALVLKKKNNVHVS